MEEQEKEQKKPEPQPVAYSTKFSCTLCGKCYTGKCPWGIATNDAKLAKRQNPDVAAKKMINLVHAWGHEIEEMLGGMGLNSIESLRGNRDKLRAVGLSDTEMDILGVKHAGR